MEKKQRIANWENVSSKLVDRKAGVSAWIQKSSLVGCQAFSFCQIVGSKKQFYIAESIFCKQKGLTASLRNFKSLENL